MVFSGLRLLLQKPFREVREPTAAPPAVNPRSNEVVYTIVLPPGPGYICLRRSPIRIRMKRISTLACTVTICLLQTTTGSAQANLCGSATSITPGTTCTATAGSVVGLTYTTDPYNACGTPRYDGWYRFTATATDATILMTGIGSNFTFPKLQLLAGSCGGFTSLACSNTVSGSEVINASGLAIGSTYYVRVFSAAPTGSAPATAGGFSICVVNASRIETSRSYVNVSKGSNGGTVDYLDTLEIRSTLVIRNNFADSLSFRDTLYNGKGVRLVPGSLCLRTNEGKVYKPYSDAYDADAGHRYAAGLDTVIRMNIGTGATATARGRLNNSSKPSFYGGTCIVMATYRVVVYYGYGRKINFRSGSVTYRDGATGAMYNAGFPDDSLIVYSSPGLCPTSVSVANAIGVESNGTFGIPATGAPLARNRTPSAYTNYTYQLFSASGGPNDYYYGVANNTSAVYTTLNTWNKPSGTPQYRVFGVWDIIGDHTGAANPARGNPPCDTTQPRSAANPCGYMLVINSAYKTDTAFQYTMSNLCPGTHYEISAWFRNVCYKCGCDSNGTGATSSSGYIPSGPGDSSGVQPNIAISVNGVDYYTTGNLPYLGVTPRGSDSTNRWVKKGFIYVTGPSETGFTLTIRNNAPGGGGNDWALDDISVTTCLPNMKYSPSNNPTVCFGNAISISDTVRSYYNSYRFYKWQRSTDGGTTWADLAGTSGTASPVWNGSAWQYVTTYTIPPAWTQLPNNGNRYRVVVGTTAANLLNANCNFTDGVAIITLNIIDCGAALDTRLLSFAGRVAGEAAVLHWTTSQEAEAVSFEVERSTDGRSFVAIGTVAGAGNRLATANNYRFTDTASVPGTVYYRVALQQASGRRTLSHTVALRGDAPVVALGSVINPFGASLEFEMTVAEWGTVDAALLDAAGRHVRKQSFAAEPGSTNLSFPHTQTLAPGMYILQVRCAGKTFSRKVVKR